MLTSERTQVTGQRKYCFQVDYQPLRNEIQQKYANLTDLMTDFVARHPNFA